MGQQQKKDDRKSNRTRHKNKRGPSRDQIESPEIPDGGERRLKKTRPPGGGS